MKQLPIILFLGSEEHYVYPGTLEEAIKYVKSDRRYRNYGHEGAQIYTGALRYEISEAGQVHRYSESEEYGYA